MTEGTKYHPLFEHLLFSGQGALTMSFSEIEAVIAARLPPSARMREEWWSNSPTGHSQARAWMRASYRTSNVNLAAESVTFKLEGWPGRYASAKSVSIGQSSSSGLGEDPQSAYQSPQSKKQASTNHPLFGIWKGKVTLLPDYDYTQPAFADSESK